MFESSVLNRPNAFAANDAASAGAAILAKPPEQISEYSVANLPATQQVNKSDASSKPQADTVTLSRGKLDEAPTTYSRSGKTASEDKVTAAPKSGATEEYELSEADLELVERLKARDAEVRAHELAHAAVGGRYAGAPTYTYQTGPDGRRYAVGGEVSIDVSKGRTPEETIEKARIIRAAANAPAEPSAQDRRVAAEAAQMSLDAQRELQQMRVEEQKLEQERAAEERAVRAEEINAQGSTAEGDAAAQEEERPLPFDNPDRKNSR